MDATTRLTLWRVQRAVRTMGWPAIGGVALAVFAAGLFVSSVMPLQTQVAALREQVRQLETHSVGGRSRTTETAYPDAQLDAFYGEFPRRQQAPETVRRLHAHARSAGLVLERGEYRPLPDTSGKLVRYQIQLPVRGSYPQVRDFLGRAMRSTPGLALDGIGFQREDDSQAIEAQLRFTVFLRADA